MSKNVNVNGVDYSGVSQVQLKTADGGMALFKDVDEIAVPSGTKSITANGTYDVSAFASAEVNVPSTGGGGAYEGITECRQIVFTPESQQSGTSFSVAHGCSATPDLILIVANAESSDEDIARDYQIKKYILPVSDKFLTTGANNIRHCALRTYGSNNTAGDQGPQVKADETNVTFTNEVAQRWAIGVTYTMWCIVF